MVSTGWSQIQNLSESCHMVNSVSSQKQTTYAHFYTEPIGKQTAIELSWSVASQALPSNRQLAPVRTYVLYFERLTSWSAPTVITFRPFVATRECAGYATLHSSSELRSLQALVPIRVRGPKKAELNHNKIPDGVSASPSGIRATPVL